MVILDDSEACRFEAIHCLLVMLTYLNFVLVGLIRSISSVILDSACARHAVYHDLTKHQPWPTEKNKNQQKKTKLAAKGDTPWKINMEPTNHPFRKENDLPNLHDYVPC